MSQFDFGVINPTTKNGTELATDLNSDRDAMHSMHSGTGRPSYAAAGTMWLNTTTTTWVMNLYDGADDIVLFNVDTIANSAQFAGDTLALTDSGTTTTLSVVRSGTPPTTELAIFDDQAVANNFSNIVMKAHRPGLIFEDATPGDHFRLGVDANLFKISIDNDNDLVKGAAGHFDDIENAFVVDGVTGKIGMGSSDLLARVLHLESGSAGTIAPATGADDLVIEGSVDAGMTIYSGNASFGSIHFGDADGDSPGIFRYNHDGNSFDWFTGGTERMSLRQAGLKLGVVQDPLGLLHLESATAGVIAPHADADELVIEGSGHSGLSIFSGNTSKGSVYFGDDGAANAGIIRYDHDTGRIQFHTSSTLRMAITASGAKFGNPSENALGGIHVETTSAGAIAPNASADELILENGASCGLSIFSGTIFTGNIFFGDSGGNNPGRITYDHNTGDLSLWAMTTEFLTATSTLVEFNVGNLGTMDFIINGVQAGAMTFTADGSDVGEGKFNFAVPVRLDNGFQLDDTTSSETITAGGEININEEQMAISLTSNSGTTDNLDEIIGGVTGQVISLEASGAGGGHTITIRHNQTPGGGGNRIITQAQGNKIIANSVDDIMFLMHMGGAWKQWGGTV